MVGRDASTFIGADLALLTAVNAAPRADTALFAGKAPTFTASFLTRREAVIQIARFPIGTTPTIPVTTVGTWRTGGVPRI
jgi:hypothetical protein